MKIRINPNMIKIGDVLSDGTSEYTINNIDVVRRYGKILIRYEVKEGYIYSDELDRYEVKPS